MRCTQLSTFTGTFATIRPIHPLPHGRPDHDADLLGAFGGGLDEQLVMDGEDAGQAAPRRNRRGRAPQAPVSARVVLMTAYSPQLLRTELSTEIGTDRTKRPMPSTIVRSTRTPVQPAAASP